MSGFGSSPTRSGSESDSIEVHLTETRKRKGKFPSNSDAPPLAKKNASSPSITSVATHTRARRSEVWKVFRMSEENPERAICTYCQKTYACSAKDRSTTNLKRHMETCKSYLAYCEEQGVLIGVGEEGGTCGNLSMRDGHFNQAACRKAAVKMIIVDELPFSFIEKEGFRHFCSVAVPRFDVPSRRTITRDILQLYADEKIMLKSIFSAGNQRVSLTTDIWTSIQNINYMVITGHFIDSDWQLHRRILSFCPINNHKGDTIGRLIESCLQHWGIERIFTVTVDNASANAVAITQLVRKMRTWRGDALVLNGEYVHMRCCAHILNLVVSDGLKELDDSIIAIRNAVKYVRSSPSRLEAFKSAVARERIESKGSVILDVPT